MKRKIGVLILLILLTCGCSKKSGTLTCTNETKSENNTYTSTLESKISYKDGYVTTVTTKEEIVAKTDEQAKEFKNILESYYIEYNQVEGFTNTIEQKNKTVTSLTTIDYKNIDTNKLIKLDEGNKSIIKNGKVYIKDIKNSFVEQGASCK